MQPDRTNTSNSANPVATTDLHHRRARRLNVRYEWSGEQRERCFRIVEGDLVPCECLAYPTSPGLGDAVAAATKSVGVNPCGGCARRQAAMNRATPAWARRMLGWWSRHFGVP